MGGPGSGRWPRGLPKGTPRYAADRNPKAGSGPKPVPAESHIGAIQPRANSEWGPITKAWWKAIGMSDTARVYQEIDWMNAWIAAEVLDQLDEQGYSAGLLKEWHTMVERLHAPRLDLLEAEPDPGPDGEADEDELEAEAEISDIASRLAG